MLAPDAFASPRRAAAAHVTKAVRKGCMTPDHDYRDFRCPDCGALVTCLSCVELQAASCFHGPAFVIANRSPTVTVAEEVTGPSSTSVPPPITQHQQPLFA